MEATPLILGLGVQELVIILVIILLLFGGSRLAGLGKSTGRALKEFKEETKGLRDDKDKDSPDGPAGLTQAGAPPQISGDPAARPATWQQPPAGNVVDPSPNDARKDG